LVFLGYEDGLICCWDISTKKFRFPMIGHTNRINGLDQAGGLIYSCANDCTVRQWETQGGCCVNIFKFADPINATKVDFPNSFMYTASWDKMIRVVDLKKNVIMKSFVASKETIKTIKLSD
jgi:WD40 repeat protein